MSFDIKFTTQDFLFIVTHIVGVCHCSVFCCTLLYALSSFAIILMGKMGLVDLLSLSSLCPVMVVWLFLAVPWVFFIDKKNPTSYFKASRDLS